MNTTHYERLSTLDATFLSFEDGAAHMHVGAVSCFDAAPLRTERGGLDFARIESCMMQILPRHARLRQKVWWPAGGPPVWVDDPHFDPTYHFRRIALPSPGGDRELKCMVGRILSSSLDPDRPLWESWIVEGLSNDRFCVIWKLHHCLADGVSVRDILIGYLGFAPSSEIPEIPAYAPRRAPSAGRLHLDLALHRFEKSREAAERLQKLVQDGAMGSALAEAAAGLVHVGASFLTETAPAPFNGEIGPHRRFDWTSCDLSVLKQVSKEAGAKINDVVLAIVCGAMRRYLLEKKVAVDDLPFRVMVPVSTRATDDHSASGNRVSNLTIPLPLYETDPKRRLRTIIETTTQAKLSGQSWVGDLLMQMVDWAGIQTPLSLARLAARQMPANLVVTNIRGPDAPQYLLEAQLTESFPVVPLSTGQGLGIALYSYDRVMHWGFNADRERMPDVGRLVKAIDEEIVTLSRAYVPLPVTLLRPVVAPAAARILPVAKPSRKRERVKQHAN